METKHFTFPLEVVDDWPPVAAEGMPLERTRSGWKVLVPPLFVNKLSVGDVLSIRHRQGTVSTWKHVSRSGDSTIWLLSRRASGDRKALALLRRLNTLGCHTAEASALSVYSVRVPGAVPLAAVDAILARRNEREIAVAYPSLRHADDEPSG